MHEPVLKMSGGKLVMVRDAVMIGQLVMVGRLTMREVLTAICNLVPSVARMGMERTDAASSRCIVSKPVATTVAPAMTTSVPSSARYRHWDY